MRLVAWNCNGGFHRKSAALAALAPDVAVICECADPEIVACKAPLFAPTDALWMGDNPQRGLGVFSFGGYRLSRARRYDPSIPYALPVRVKGAATFNLLAMWAHYGRAPLTRVTPGPTLRALRSYGGFLGERASILAGDLNNHIRWDRPGKASNHANAVLALDGIGMVSAYHAFLGLAQGSERHATLYWRDRTSAGPTYHIDYAFVPKASLASLRSVAIGTYADWVAPGLSDHAPLILEFAPGFG
jgi:exodeoxyribonuclease III